MLKSLKTKFQSVYMALFLMCFMLDISAFSQGKEIDFDNIRVKNGLSNSWVNCIVEDSRGVLWIGTRYGLNIYNGTNFDLLLHDPKNDSTISSNDISTLLNTKAGKIIVGTWGGGINVIDPISRSITKTIKHKELLKYAIKSVIEKDDSTIWIATYGEGCYEYNYKSDNLIAYTSKIEDDLLFEYCENMHFFNDTIWVVTRNAGLCYLIEKDYRIVKCDFKNVNFKNSKEITAINDDGEKLVVATHYGDLFKVTPDLFQVSDYHTFKEDGVTPRVINIEVDKNKNFWINTTNGFYFYDIKHDKYQEVVDKKTIRKMTNSFYSFIDSRNILWVCSWGDGLYKYRLDDFGFIIIDLPEFDVKEVKSITELENHQLLLGTTNGLLNYDRIQEEISFKKIKGEYSTLFKRKPINTIALHDEGFLVSVEGEGLFIVDSSLNAKKHRFSDEISSMANDIKDIINLGDNVFFIGTWNHGVAIINENDNSFQKFDSNDKIDLTKVFTSFLDREGKIWIGYRDGVCLFDPKNRVFDFNPFSLAKNTTNKLLKDVRSITQDLYGTIWFSASNGLVCYYPEGNKFIELPKNNEDFHNTFYNMKMFNDDLWATSNSGLIKINVKTYQTERYTTKEGLVSNSFNKQGIFIDKQGIMFLGNGKKIVYFHPNKKEIKRDDYDVYLKNLLINNVELNNKDYYEGDISQSKIINLSYDKNNITIDVDVVRFEDDNNGTYAHRLLGFDDRWFFHDVRDSKIKYTNLEPGEYVLEYTKLNFGVPSEKNIKAVKIIIDKPFWLKWSFKLLFILLIFIVLYLIYKSIQFQKKALEFKVKERTSQIVLQNKKLEEHDTAMQSNMNYAALIQRSLLTNDFDIKQGFDKYFIFYQPKDVVSGDFYWYTKIGSKNIFVVADCTGHGVSGAFLSILGFTTLKSIISSKNILRPDLILNELHAEVTKSLKGKGAEQMKDGMDISIMCYDEDTKLLEISSALLSVLLVNKKDGLSRVKGDRYPIGGGYSQYQQREKFTLHTQLIEEPTTIYLFTDGYQDQFGGPQGKKFMQKKFRDLLLYVSKKNIEEQKRQLITQFNNWQGDAEQVDDVLVVGINITP